MAVQISKDNLSLLSNSELKDVVLNCMSILEDHTLPKGQTHHSLNKSNQNTFDETKNQPHTNKEVNQNEKDDNKSIEEEFEFLDHPMISPFVTPQINQNKKYQKNSLSSTLPSPIFVPEPVPFLDSENKPKETQNQMSNKNPMEYFILTSANINLIDFSVLSSVEESALGSKFKCEKLINGINQESFGISENKSIDEIKKIENDNLYYHHHYSNTHSVPYSYDPCFSHLFSALPPHIFWKTNAKAQDSNYYTNSW
ncbi:uncharacterized protein ASCRUDRAFT_78110 [Ascoidea rubescens DSM 1968]|uniref:Uncharacterized protein n=1 Tax=Ascoidea rubescens DSM 1968 TaxID=1344418 RepID=A0A1D2V9F7_9ASCO|nr:hypothetical protein ASCRUDRAFT_78110 [Ascoidea rubescens DSM 1968]ODV58209.1 hypothetical protein ASCRUDRAFT_78110 [Ascoidea rubescens DSM 1968]